MAYLEPGVYSKTVSTRSNTGSGAPNMFPLLIGSGDTEIQVTEVIKRTEDAFDVLPNPIKRIISVGFSSGKSDFSNRSNNFSITVCISSSSSLISWTREIINFLIFL